MLGFKKEIKNLKNQQYGLLSFIQFWSRELPNFLGRAAHCSAYANEPHYLMINSDV